MRVDFEVLDPMCTPTLATDGSAGFDLRAREDWESVNYTATIPLGVKVSIPRGCVGFIRGWSGLAFRYVLDHSVAAFDGTIDSDFRDELKALLYPLDREMIRALGIDKIEKGDRVCQLVVVPCCTHGFANGSRIEPEG